MTIAWAGPERRSNGLIATATANSKTFEAQF
ncbi:hypothetical protein J2847_002974 [Azospirillum agricola]|nr:hypothetical protein [Azospirillum agricola]